MNRTIENQKFADIDIFVSYFDKKSLILLLRTVWGQGKIFTLIMQLEMMKTVYVNRPDTLRTLSSQEL